MGDSSFVQVVEKVDGDIMELPIENDGSVLLSTLQAQFPTAIGLKYKSSTGGWRGVRAVDNVLDAPHEGWEDIIFCITESSVLKRSSSDTGSEVVSKTRKSNLLDDLIVLGLPYSITEEGLEKYFAVNCGELAFHELKYNRETKKSRGFGFIRFKTEEGAKEALNGKHSMDGRKLEIRMSRAQETSPTKLFIGRLPEAATEEDVRTHFSEYGELLDLFVPNPFRGFAFVTYSCKEDASDALRDTHCLKGVALNVTAAEPKGHKDKLPAGGAMNNSPWNNYGMNYGRMENPVKLFIGRLPHGVGQFEVKEYFSKFGPLSDIFVPNPFRGFGFVTYCFQEDGMRVLNMSHTLQGTRLHITPAEPKKGDGQQDTADVTQNKSANYTWKPSGLNGNSIPSLGFEGVPPQQKDTASEIKDLLLALINKR